MHVSVTRVRHVANWLADSWPASIDSFSIQVALILTAHTHILKQPGHELHLQICVSYDVTIVFRFTPRTCVCSITLHLGGYHDSRVLIGMSMSTLVFVFVPLEARRWVAAVSAVVQLQSLKMLESRTGLSEWWFPALWYTIMTEEQLSTHLNCSIFHNSYVIDHSHMFFGHLILVFKEKGAKGLP